MVHRRGMPASSFIVRARNVMTGQVVEIPISTRDDVKRMKWYPHNDYVPIEIKKGGKKYGS